MQHIRALGAIDRRIMKNLILITLVFFASCVNRSQSNQQTTSLKSGELSDSFEIIGDLEITNWLTTSNHNSISANFEDTCLTTELEVVTLDLTDSTLNLVNKCDSLNIGILAANYQYPDGSVSIRSSITKNTILTVSIGEYMGDYFTNDYYELITDSVTTERTLINGTLSQISRDSIRTTKRYEL